MSIYTATDLLNSVKKRGFVPRSQQTYVDADILRFANEEMVSHLMPLITSYDEDYYVTEITQSLTAGKNKYKIPARAAFRKLKDVYLRDSSGNVLNMARLNRANNEFFDNNTSSEPFGYYLEGDKIVLVPQGFTLTGYDLVFVVFFRPSELVLESETRTVLSTSGNTITLNSAPPAGWSAGTKLDIVEAQPSSSIVDYDLVISSISGTVITFTSTPDSEILVGDYVALANKTPVIQAPQEMHPILVEYVVLRLYQSHGDQQGYNNTMSRIQQLRDDIANIFEDRVYDSAPKIVNRYSILRTGGNNGGRRTTR